MFKLFKKKTPVEKLQLKYAKLMKEAFEISKSNRIKSDEKIAEAEKVLDQIKVLKK